MCHTRRRNEYCEKKGEPVSKEGRTEASNPYTAKIPIFHNIAHFAHYILRICILYLDFEIFK
jgi:hypothetical protein